MYRISVFILAFVISYFIAGFFAKKKDNKKTVKAGGAIIFVSVILAILAAGIAGDGLKAVSYDLKKIAGFALGAIIMLALGIYDDARKLGYKAKFAWQAIATVPIILSGYNIYRLSFFGNSMEIYPAGPVLIICWVILITNAVNLIDGLDGLACGVGIITFSALAVISHVTHPAVEILCLACMGSLLAFLRYNFYPAKLYLGDSGSLLLGFTLAVLSLEINVKMNTLTALSLPVLVLFVPIGSAIYSFSRRLRKGKNPFVADRLHLHHLLLNSGISQAVIVGLFWLSSFVLAMLGVVSYFLNRRLELFILSLGIIVLIICYASTIIIISRERKKNGQV